MMGAHSSSPVCKNGPLSLQAYSLPVYIRRRAVDPVSSALLSGSSERSLALQAMDRHHERQGAFVQIPAHLPWKREMVGQQARQ
jgi:hypothetical protein